MENNITVPEYVYNPPINCPLVTIIIPCYEMHGMGSEFLHFSFEKIKNQTYKNINIIISDQSKDCEILNKSNEWSNILNIKYLLNENDDGKSSVNLNFAMKHILKETKYIKFLFQDDFLYDENSIKHIVDEFQKDSEKKWLISSCCHSKSGSDFYYFLEPYYYDEIYKAEPNSISSPSVLTIRNGLDLYFDEKLAWLMDVEYYKRMHNNFGDPIVLKKTTVVNRVWEKQVSNTLSSETKEIEMKYVLEKYNN